MYDQKVYVYVRLLVYDQNMIEAYLLYFMVSEKKDTVYIPRM